MILCKQYNSISLSSTAHLASLLIGCSSATLRVGNILFTKSKQDIRGQAKSVKILVNYYFVLKAVLLEKCYC